MRVTLLGLVRTAYVVVAALLSATLLPRLGVPQEWVPDLVLIGVVATAVLRGPVHGALVGLVAGWVVELVPPVGSPLGLTPLVHHARRPRRRALPAGVVAHRGPRRRRRSWPPVSSCSSAGSPRRSSPRAASRPPTGSAGSPRRWPWGCSPCRCCSPSTGRSCAGGSDEAARRGSRVSCSCCSSSLFGLLVARLGQVQLVQGAQLTAQAASVHTRTITEHALRGQILDRTGAPLVGQLLHDGRHRRARGPARRRRRRARPRRARSPACSASRSTGCGARRMLCGTAGAPRAPACFNGSPYVPIPIATDVDPQRALTLMEQPEKFPGIGVAPEPARSYPAPAGANAAHLLGLGRPGRRRRRRVRRREHRRRGRRRPVRPRGAVRRRAAGRNGATVVAIDPRGVVTDTLSSRNPVPGSDVVTHLDARLQARTEAVLAQTVARARADGLRADCGGGRGPRRHQRRRRRGGQPPGIRPRGLHRRHQQRRARGVERRDPRRAPEVADHDRDLPAGLDVQGDLRARRRRLRGEPRRHLRLLPEPHRRRPGVQELRVARLRPHRPAPGARRVVRHRLLPPRVCRVAGPGRASPPRPGPTDPFVQTARAFGIGRATGVDLPGESAGRLPDRAWKEQYWAATRARDAAGARRAATPRWRGPDPTRAAYLTPARRRELRERAGSTARATPSTSRSGRATSRSRPLQMAQVYAAIANGGTLWQPQVAAGVRSPAGAVTPIAPRAHRQLSACGPTCSPTCGPRWPT